MKISASLIGILALIFGLVVIGCGDDDDDDEYQVDNCIDDVAWKANECFPSYSAKEQKEGFARAIQKSDFSSKLEKCLCNAPVTLGCSEFQDSISDCLCKYYPAHYGNHYNDYCY